MTADKILSMHVAQNTTFRRKGFGVNPTKAGPKTERSEFNKV